MSSPSASLVCVVCGHILPAAGQACPECRASAEWQDLIGAVRFAQARFEQWERDGLIGREEAAWIAQADKECRRGLNLSAREGRPLPSEIQLVPPDRCWSCNARLCGSPSHCPGCGAPAGIVLLATGFMFQLRSTTLTGAALLTVYLVTLVLYINMLENVQTAAIWMTIGGGTIFAAGLLLSIYRDRLLTLPDQVKRREGVFRVLGWR
jgi:hypothetical protein